MTQVTLPPLRSPESGVVVQAVLGTVSLPETRLRALVAQAGGNPFFLEELAWHTVEQGEQDILETVSETVYAVLAARIDRLPPEEKRLLQTAAVIGPEVPVSLLQALAEQSEVLLHHGLAHLQAAEFLYETQLFPKQRYTFKHALIQEVAYSSLLLERRRILHVCLVEILEAFSPDQLPEQVDRLAHRALRGEVWDKILAYCRQAGSKALARSAYREAVCYFEQALNALAHLPARRNTHEQAIDLRLALRVALHPYGALRRAMAYLGEAEALAATLADAVSLLTQVVEQNMAIEVVVDQALCGLTLGETQMLAGHLDEACTLAEQALSISYAHKERGHQAYALRLLGDIAARREPPEVTQAERHYRQALDLAEELGMRPLQGHCHLGLGTLYATTAQRQQTQAELSKSIEMYRAMDMTLWLPQAETALAQTGQGERLARGIS